MVKVSELAIYPVKSCGQVSVDNINADNFGLHMDRRWMLVDEKGLFLSQRKLPRMCLIQPLLLKGGLRLQAPKMDALEVEINIEGILCEVKVWGDICQAQDCGDKAANWFSTFLETKCRLVYFPEATVRQVDPGYAKPGDTTAFSDGFPFLLISGASLEDLNHRMQQQDPEQPILEMQRFRPNIVVSGCDAFAEDAWSRIQIGETILRLVKPCSRCVIPSIDPMTGHRGEEPIRTLKSYRRGVCGQKDSKLYFGQNVIAESIGYFEVGMSVSIIE